MPKIERKIREANNRKVKNLNKIEISTTGQLFSIITFLGSIKERVSDYISNISENYLIISIISNYLRHPIEIPQTPNYSENIWVSQYLS